jgi:hypothetical protein
MIYERETRQLIGCLYDVHNEVGIGRQEAAYHAACRLWLEAHEVPFMGLDRVHHERIVCDEKSTDLIQSWKHWKNRISGKEQHIGEGVRNALVNLYAEHGVGYGSDVTRKLVQCSLRCNGLPYTSAPICPAFFQGRKVDESPLDCVVIDNCIVLVISALFDSNEFNLSRGISFLKALGLEWGIAANFGKQRLEVNGLHSKRQAQTST